MRRHVTAMLVTAAALTTVIVPPPAHAQLKNPSDWTWRLDTPATLVSTLDVPDQSWLFVMMPPGWHVTTGPGALLFPTDLRSVEGNFSLEAQVFLFPGKSAEEYGVFIGGSAADAQAPAEYTAFVLRRDGQAAVLTRSRDGASTPAAWRPHDAIVVHTGGTDPVKNVLRLDVDPVTVTLSVNGTKVLDVPRASVRSSGLVGFRVGKDLNLHITSLDVTRRYAPQPTRQPKP